jgi:hypothetical protein
MYRLQKNKTFTKMLHSIDYSLSPIFQKYFVTLADQY